MSDAETPADPGSAGSDVTDDDDGVARVTMRLPQAKYDWLQEELDSFTSDTARLQYLVQLYADSKAAADR